MSKVFKFKGKTYELVEIGLGMHSYCSACAFYSDEDGCETAEGCMEDTGSIDTTYVWVERDE